MRPSHPLDRPVWNALATRQAHFALGDARARRFLPDHGPFAAARNTSPENLAALAALISSGRSAWLVEADEPPLPPGMRLLRRAICDQMTVERVTADAPGFEALPLGEADAAEMLALATLTEPGPFLPRTHRLGAFIGVREGGRLVAMAGERMRPEGFTEVSGVCTHPDHRGRGYARGLMSLVASRIIERGETPFLHVYPDNAGAIALYETLGFASRRQVVLTVIGRE